MWYVNENGQLCYTDGELEDDVLADLEEVAEKKRKQSALWMKSYLKTLWYVTEKRHVQRLRERAHKDSRWANQYVSAKIGFQRRWSHPEFPDS
jgi:hypothetical protein